jgi:hypothetical protein
LDYIPAKSSGQTEGVSNHYSIDDPLVKFGGGGTTEQNEQFLTPLSGEFPVLDPRTPMLVPYYSRTLSFRQGVGGTNDRYGSAYLYPLCTFCQCKPIYAHLIVGYSYGRVEKKI